MSVLCDIHLGETVIFTAHFVLIVMKRVMVNNSTNVNKTNNHISPQIIKHKKDHDISS
jgi:hypothetical protein